jgi:hypothetical protein
LSDTTVEFLALLLGLGRVARDRGDLPSAHSLFAECLIVAREAGHRLGVARAVKSLGDMASDQGDYEVARRFYAESLAIHSELEERASFVSLLEAFANLAAQQAEPQIARAACLWGALEARREEMGSPCHCMSVRRLSAISLLPATRSARTPSLLPGRKAGT